MTTDDYVELAREIIQEVQAGGDEYDVALRLVKLYHRGTQAMYHAVSKGKLT